MVKEYQVQDKYFFKAKALGYRARSVFKLEEIQNKFSILKPGLDVLDIGAAPGSWLQYAAKIVGNKAHLVGVDLLAIKPIANNVKTIQIDIFKSELEGAIAKVHPEKFSIILSDLAPATSGIKSVDQTRSLELSERVVKLAQKFMRTKGTLVIKVFQGEDIPDFIASLKTNFRQVKIFKPKSSRDRSFEVYIIANR